MQRLLLFWLEKLLSILAGRSGGRQIALGLRIFEQYFRGQPDKLFAICQDYIGRKQWFFRFIAGKYVGRFLPEQPEVVITLLEKLAIDPVWQVREGAAWGMASMWIVPDNRLTDFYFRWFEDEREHLRATAALSLIPVIRKGDPAFLPLLIPLLDRLVTDQGKVVRNLVGSQIVGKALAETFPLKAKECLQRWLVVRLPITHWQITRALPGPLAKSFPEDVLEIVKSLHYQDHALVRKGIIAAIKRLSQSTNPELALAAHKYAEEIGGAAAENLAYPNSKEHQNDGF